MSSGVHSNSHQNPSDREKFICGVVEGFYGRPWTTGQRKDLFGKMNRWGLDGKL